MAYISERLPDLPIPGRDGCNLFVFDSGTGPKLHIANGWSAEDPVNFPTMTCSDLSRIDDPETGEATLLHAAQAYAPRHTGGFAVGADGFIHNFTADIQLGEYDQKHWVGKAAGSRVTNRLQSDGQLGRRVLALSGTLGDLVLLAGGQEYPLTLGPETSAVAHTDVLAFDTAAPEAGWTVIEANCPALPRTTTCRIPELGGDAFFYGGSPEHSAGALGTVYRSDGTDFSAGGMTLILTDARLARKYSANAAFDGRLWQLFGTLAGVNHAGVYSFLPDGSGFQTLAHDMPASHAGDACVGPDGHLYYACGSSNVGEGGAMTACSRVYRIRVV